jgi:hypothetical protein
MRLRPGDIQLVSFRSGLLFGLVGLLRLFIRACLGFLGLLFSRVIKVVGDY